MENNSIFFQCQVLNIEDPMMLGRIRGVRLIDNYDDILKSISDPPWNEEKDIWTSRDPFVFNPLMPYFMYQVPKVTEMAQVIYLNKDFKYQNQYFVQNTFSSPTATFRQFNFGANKFGTNGPKKSLTGDSSERVDTRVLQIIYQFDKQDMPIFSGQQMDVYIEDLKK